MSDPQLPWHGAELGMADVEHNTRTMIQDAETAGEVELADFRRLQLAEMTAVFNEFRAWQQSCNHTVDADAQNKIGRYKADVDLRIHCGILFFAKISGIQENMARIMLADDEPKERALRVVGIRYETLGEADNCCDIYFKQLDALRYKSLGSLTALHAVQSRLQLLLFQTRYHDVQRPLAGVL
jgi:hypothetical protein